MYLFYQVWNDSSFQTVAQAFKYHAALASAGRNVFVLYFILQVLDSTVEDDSRLEAKRKDIYKSIAMTVKRDLSKAMEEGLIPQIDAEIVSYMLVGLLETAYLLMSLDSRYGADDLLDAMVALFYLPVADPLSPSR